MCNMDAGEMVFDNLKLSRSKVAIRHKSRIPSWHLGNLELRTLNANDSSNNRLSAFLISSPANKGHGIVKHKRTHEWGYVLRGSVIARLEKRKTIFKKGTYFYIPPGAWHSFVAGKRGSEVLCVFQPPIDRKNPDILRGDH